jgi:hypothetical protein
MVGSGTIAGSGIMGSGVPSGSGIATGSTIMSGPGTGTGSTPTVVVGVAVGFAGTVLDGEGTVDDGAATVEPGGALVDGALGGTPVAVPVESTVDGPATGTLESDETGAVGLIASAPSPGSSPHASSARPIAMGNDTVASRD